MSCDRVGNILLVKFAFVGANRDARVFLPASIVFWLLDNVPVNQDPTLQPPPPMPVINHEDWEYGGPRVLSVQCKQFADSVRMTMELEVKPDLVVVLDRSNLELMRQVMEAYRADLMDLDA